jgi:hypothetical protein
VFCPFVTFFTDIMRLTTKIRQIYTIHIVIIHVFVEAGEAVVHLNQVLEGSCRFRGKNLFGEIFLPKGEITSLG